MEKKKPTLSDYLVILVLSFVVGLAALFVSDARAEKFISSEVKTGSYTVPKGKYGVVYPWTADLQINSNGVAYTRSVTWGENGSGVATTYSVVMGAGYYCWPAIGRNGTGTVKDSSLRMQGDSGITIRSLSSNGFLATGCESGTGLLLSSNAGAGGAYTAVTSTLSFIPFGGSFKVRSGDVLTGPKYLIELYER